MAPKADPRNKGKVEAVPKLSLLESTFPIWSEVTAANAATAKETPDKFDDPVGLMLPPAAQPFLDAWKRPEELVQNVPNLPVVLTQPLPAPATEQKDGKAIKGAAPPPASRELDGKLWAGHNCFEWLVSVFTSVMSAHKALPQGDYLWELIHPKDPKDGTHMRPASGKYRVRLFIMDTWRTVVIDDRIPVDLFGRPLLVGSRPLQLWPLLLSKAVLKVMVAMRVLDLALPHQVPAFQLLTGWPQEDLLDPLSGVQLAGGLLFDRLEDTVKGNASLAERHAIATVCLKKRTLPDKPPPRIIVLTGPSAVGRASLTQRLVSEFPDKFGVTVSHTTRRPREHEVHGRDYYFTTKAALRAEVAAGRFLEASPVARVLSHTSRPGTRSESYLYGVSIDTVREVAATGKLCIVGIEEQGVAALQANKRIDGLYIYIQPPSLQELEQRIRSRSKEAASTIKSRLAWAAQQVAKSAKPGLFDHVVENTEFEPVYRDVKEAISTLSPIIRNRLRGLPAYVLDYSDLIPPNLVETPFLKPIIIAGPNTGERKQLLEQLVREFPDVFAFPRLTTTWSPDEQQQYQLSSAELAAHSAAQEARRREEQQRAEAALAHLPPSSRPSTAGVGAPGAWSDAQHGPEAQQAEGDGAGAPGAEEGPGEGGEAEGVPRPEPVSVSAAEFDEAIGAGRLLEHHTDLFTHPMAAHRTGVSRDAILEVMKRGRLPLLELEAEGVEAIKARGVECLAVFLAPPSLDLFSQRLHHWLSETDQEVAARLKLAAMQMAAASRSTTYDHTLVNDDLDAAYHQLKQFISHARPDILVSEEEQQALAALAKASGPGKQPILVITGPAHAGRESVVTQLVATFPDVFAVPTIVTDRKPGKGEAAASPATDFVSAKELAKLAAEGQLVLQRQGEAVGKESGSQGITVQALAAVTNANKVAVLELPDPAGVAALKANPLTSMALFAFVASQQAAAAAGHVAHDSSALEAAAQEARISQQYHLVVDTASGIDLMAIVRNALSEHVPAIVPQPHRPLVVAGPFGTGKRVLLGQLFDRLPGKFAAPALTTTRESPHPEADDRSDMVVISAAEAAQLAAQGAFLFTREALGHTYGVQVNAVKKVQATGKVCVVELDHVEDAKKLRASGFDATFLFIGMSSMDALLRRIQSEVASNPPLGYTEDEATAQFFQVAKAEVLASMEQGLFDSWIELDDDQASSFGRLSESLHLHYPSVVVAHFVHGYGRGLWDPSVRSYGCHALKVMVLGPAAVGKTSHCELLASRFGLPHINVGDLLFSEIANKTSLGLEAKQFMDASKTVPDAFLLKLLAQRVAQADCQQAGWLLDGFPHTGEQVEALKQLGVVPDKVIFLAAEQAVLLDRTRYRRVDMNTNKVYHMAEQGALSATIRPLTKEGLPDAAALARLHPRHDDSEDNVMARLALWDKHHAALRAAYEDVSLRINTGDGALPAAACDKAAAFLALEATVKELQVVPSYQLEKLQYEVVDTIRYRRQQLLRLWQADGNKSFWVDCRELVGNAHCLLLERDYARFSVTRWLRRMDLTAVPRSALLWINSPEPCQVLVSLALGPQAPITQMPVMPHKLLVVSGPCGVGKSLLLSLLLGDHPHSLHLVRPLSTRPPRKGQTATHPFHHVSPDQLIAKLDAGELVADLVVEHAGFQYALPQSSLDQAWEAGKVPVMEAPVTLATALRVATQPKPASPVNSPLAATKPGSALPLATKPRASSTGDVAVGLVEQEALPGAELQLSVVSVYVTADLDTLDVRMREVGQLEEQELQEELRAAAAQMDSVQHRLAAYEQGRAAALARAAKVPSAYPGVTPVAGARGSAAAAEAAATAAAAAALVAACTRPAGVPDLVLSNMERSPLNLLMQLKAVAADLWHKPRVPIACQVLLEEFDWKASGLCPTRKRLRTLMASSSCLELDRGQHLLRVVASPDYLHALTFYATPPCPPDKFICQAGELSNVLAEVTTAMGPAASDLPQVQTLEGAYDALAPGTTIALLRFNFTVTSATRLVASLALSGDDARAVTQLVLVDNQSKRETTPVGRLGPMMLDAHEAGYTLLAVARVPQLAAPPTHPAGVLLPPSTHPSAAGPEASGGTWCLQLLSSHPLMGLQEVSVSRSQAVDGSYHANKRCVLARQVLTPLASLQAALAASTDPPLPFVLRVLHAVTGQEVGWTKEYPVLLQRAAPGGRLLVGNLALGPGKYLVEMSLMREQCPLGWQPDPVTGMLTAAPSSGAAVLPLLDLVAGAASLESQGAGQTAHAVKWQLVVMPSVDDKVCPLTTDESQARYIRSLQDAWATAALSATPAASAMTTGGGKPGKPAAGARAAPAGAGGSRAALAAALLDKALAAAATADPSPPVPLSPTRNGKGSPLRSESPSPLTPAPTPPQPVIQLTRSIKDVAVPLDPNAHLHVIPGSDTASPGRVSAEELQGRLAYAESVNEVAKAAAAAIAASLADGKGQRQELLAAASGEFGDRRRAAQAGHQDVVAARAAAVRAVKNAAANAAAEVAAALAAKAAAEAALVVPQTPPVKAAAVKPQLETKKKAGGMKAGG